MLLDAAACAGLCHFPWESSQRLHPGLETLDTRENANALFKNDEAIKQTGERNPATVYESDL